MSHRLYLSCEVSHVVILDLKGYTCVFSLARLYVYKGDAFFYVSQGFACEWDTELLLVRPLPPTEALKMFGVFVCAGKSLKKLFNVLLSAQSWNFTNVQLLFFSS